MPTPTRYPGTGVHSDPGAKANAPGDGDAAACAGTVGGHRPRVPGPGPRGGGKPTLEIAGLQWAGAGGDTGRRAGCRVGAPQPVPRCIDGVRIGFLSPYSGLVPPKADAYFVGVWNKRRDDLVERDSRLYFHPTLTDDGSEIITGSQSQLRRILRLLGAAARNDNPDLVLVAGIFDSRGEELEGVWGEFDPAGLDDVLRYLPCL